MGNLDMSPLRKSAAAADDCAREIERAVRLTLRTGTVPGLKAVGWRFRRGVLFLRGTVPSYYHKQLAQQRVRGLRGVDLIVNLTKVE